MPLPYKPGSHGPEIDFWQAWFTRYARSYAPKADGYYGNDEVAAVKTMQSRVGQAPTGVFDQALADRVGYKPPAGDSHAVFVSVEGHTASMFFGPVADTGTQLEAEGLCRHQPTGYNNGPIPFDNQSGVAALDENIRLRVPADAKLIIAGYSQGMIVVYDYLEQHGIPKNLKGVLMYGNPNRALGSVAPWCDPGTIDAAKMTHGLDPYKRFELNGCVSLRAAGVPFVDVFRRGDIFAQNGDDKSSQIKAAVYQAVARSDVMSNPFSIAAEIADTFSAPFAEVLGAVQAMISGIGFLANNNPNPHYGAYDIEGGKNWVRAILRG